MDKSKEKLVIKNKLESVEKIKELGLNKFPEIILNKKDEKEIKVFLKKYDAKYYAIRDKSKSSGTFKLKVEKENVLKEIEGYDKFSINVSSANYEENQMLVGEICIYKNGEVYLTLTTDKTASVRDAIRNPMYNYKTDIYDKRLDSIKGFNEIYEYIERNNLEDIIVEFSLFNTNLGINKENIIIYELRTDY